MSISFRELFISTVQRSHAWLMLLPSTHSASCIKAVLEHPHSALHCCHCIEYVYVDALAGVEWGLSSSDSCDQVVPVSV